MTVLVGLCSELYGLRLCCIFGGDAASGRANLVVHDVSSLISMVFAGLSPLVIEAVDDRGGAVRVQARTAGGPVACPGCGALTARVHAYHERTVADVPLDARPVSVVVWVRRLVCSALRCAR